MTISRPFNISGVGWYLPETVVTSVQIENTLGLEHGWISNRTGVETRHIARSESNTEMAKAALGCALEDAGLGLKDLDYLIAASATFDYIIPNRSSLIKAAFPESAGLDFPCMDINTVCASFMTAVDIASCLLSSEGINHVAIVSSEKGSLGLNSQEAETYGLFGDAAAAVILSVSNDGKGGLTRYQMRTYTEGVMDTVIPGGGNVNHPRFHTYDEAKYSFQMNGGKLLRLAQQYLPGFLENLFDGVAYTLKDVDWIVPHQASKLGLKILHRLNGGNQENIIDQLSQYGNCIAASIPLALVTSIRNGTIKEMDRCLLLGTAAGMSIAGVLLTYKRS